MWGVVDKMSMIDRHFTLFAKDNYLILVTRGGRFTIGISHMAFLGLV
jgi:hypothetical protein